MRHRLSIGLNNFLQSDVLIAVAGLWIFLRGCELDGLVRASMGASQAGLAIAWRVHRLAIHHMDGAGGTYFLANPTAHTAFHYT